MEPKNNIELLSGASVPYDGMSITLDGDWLILKFTSKGLPIAEVKTDGILNINGPFHVTGIKGELALNVNN